MLKTSSNNDGNKLSDIWGVQAKKQEKSLSLKHFHPLRKEVKWKSLIFRKIEQWQKSIVEAADTAALKRI